MLSMNRRAHGTVLVLVAAVVASASGCAASSKQAQAPSASEAPSQQYGQAGYPQGAAAQPYAQPPPPPPSPEAAPASPAQPGAAAPDRMMALRSASNEVESSQRELDVAGSDCRNACRALGSMDRAAGRLCELSHGSGEENRCTDAKQRVYSARDRVRTNCGSCPNGPSVERAAPIPSLR
jgi:type IV secretory pathway VirB10-like protein